MTRITDPVRPTPGARPTSLAFVRTDGDGIITEASASFGDLVGAGPDRIVGTPYAAWGAAEWPVAFGVEMAKAIADGRAFAAYLPMGGPDAQAEVNLVLVTRLADGVLSVHAAPADPSILDQACAVHDAVAEAEAAARASGADDDRVAAAGLKATEDHWGASPWGGHDEFVAAALLTQARAGMGAATRATTPDPEDPMGRVSAAIGALMAQLGPRVDDAGALAGLGDLLRDAAFTALEATGALGRVTTAAIAGANRVTDHAPALISTARAAGRLGAGVCDGLQAFQEKVGTARAALSRLTTGLATTAIHAELTRQTAAIAWPPNDPGPGSLPAASVADLARVVASDVDALIADLADTRDALTEVRVSACGCAEQLKHMQSFMASWRVQIPQWHITDQLRAHLAVIDTRQRLAGDHIATLRLLAEATTTGIEACSAAGLLEPMNAIGQATAAARGLRGRHAIAAAPTRGAIP